MFTEKDAAMMAENLLCYVQKKGFLEEADVPYARNHLFAELGITQRYDFENPACPETLPQAMEPLLTYALEKGLIEEDTETQRDLYDTRLMDALVPRPSQCCETFSRLAAKDIRAATDWFYTFCQDVGYIRSERIARNIAWTHECRYGNLEITINLSKPEKDPREIAKLKAAPAAGYPKCLLCADNVGYAGRLNHPARQTLRVIPLTLQGERWYFQYSPYVYYDQHCIVLNARHIPMCISRETFVRLLEFTDQFPHYFLGSNADLPIVGGSILNHDHFQGGRHELPMAKAGIRTRLTLPGFSGQAGIVDWPMAAVRLRSANPEELVEAADRMLKAWRDYSDESVQILANSEGTPHNTITPIARRRGQDYELDLVLRNNRTTQEHPLGIFHPHAELHHIKKENIGLIEVMGLFILPARLKRELADLERYLSDDSLPLDALFAPDHPLQAHAQWITGLCASHGRDLTPVQAHELMERQVGEICMQVLAHAGVFQDNAQGNEAFLRFVRTLGYQTA
ncbi:MAG: UDP-glucose--hexose-1-phosphate uridylyltransferase [Eubacteriales bacterium]|nr:UDP-glucose--hexose-1-phosphate uridylyltransferase [Eubacteriales bacterium]